MVATRPFDSTKLSSRDDSLILNVLDRAGTDHDPFQRSDPERQARRLNAFVSNAVEHILAIEMLWNNLSSVAYQFGAEALHHSRRDFEQQHTARVELLDKVLNAASDYRSRFGQSATGAEKITACRELLGRMRIAILDRWVTLEDLEDLLLEKLTLPNETLKEIAKRNPPPQSWYDETFDPFEAETAP